MEDALSVHEVRRFLRSTKAKIVDSESAKREWRSGQVAGNGFRPIQIKELGTKGFDLTVKFRPHRITDHEEILKTCRQIIERIEALRQTPLLTQDQLS